MSNYHFPHHLLSSYLSLCNFHTSNTVYSLTLALLQFVNHIVMSESEQDPYTKGSGPVMLVGHDDFTVSYMGTITLGSKAPGHDSVEILAYLSLD